jgi:beta,beta-carotene 9',10'-dioxygenase
VRSGDARVWRERGCFPGEAVFVRAPGERREDDGVALSVVLDTRRRTSFLLVLDARTFSERARAEVPQPVPFGFHGGLYGKSSP